MLASRKTRDQIRKENQRFPILRVGNFFIVLPPLGGGGGADPIVKSEPLTGGKAGGGAWNGDTGCVVLPV